MAKTFGRGETWQALPLCCGYFSVHFERQLVSVFTDREASRDLDVVWALGASSDGEWEVVGAWPAPDVDSAFWRGVFDELLVRGLERISSVLADAVAGVGAVYPGVTVLPCFARIQRGGHVSLAAVSADLLGSKARRAVREAASVSGARAALEPLFVSSESGRATVLAADWPEVLAQLKPFYALRSECRALVRRGDEVLEHLGRSLSRAVVRHGPFAEVDAAVSFVGRTLARAEGRLSSLVPPVARLRGCSVRPMVARAGIAAPGH